MAVTDPKGIIEKMIRDFDERCEAEGHHWSTANALPGFEYCKACGKTRRSTT